MQTKWFRETVYWSKVIVLGVVLGVGIQFAHAAWTPRPTDPAAANVPGPLTTGVGSQTKAGGDIGLGGGGSLYAGGLIAAPTMCLGGDCRNAWPSGGGAEVDTLASVVARGNNAGGNWITVGGFTDGNDGNYFVDPNGTARLNQVQANGLYMWGNWMTAGGFSDGNDGNYYADPNWWSRFNNVGITGDTSVAWPDDNDDIATVGWVNAAKASHGESVHVGGCWWVGWPGTAECGYWAFLNFAYPNTSDSHEWAGFYCCTLSAS